MGCPFKGRLRKSEGLLEWLTMKKNKKHSAIRGARRAGVVLALSVAVGLGGCASGGGMLVDGVKGITPIDALGLGAGLWVAMKLNDIDAWQAQAQPAGPPGVWNLDLRQQMWVSGEAQPAWASAKSAARALCGGEEGIFESFEEGRKGMLLGSTLYAKGRLRCPGARAPQQAAPGSEPVMPRAPGLPALPLAEPASGSEFPAL